MTSCLLFTIHLSLFTDYCLPLTVHLSAEAKRRSLMNIVWTKHAVERLKQWERTFGITREEVESVLRDPEQVVDGDLGVKIAQAKRRGGVLRIAFKEDEGGHRIVTVYWSSRVERYWKG